jgi:hypothetical protein
MLILASCAVNIYRPKSNLAAAYVTGEVQYDNVNGKTSEEKCNFGSQSSAACAWNLTNVINFFYSNKIDTANVT